MDCARVRVYVCVRARAREWSSSSWLLYYLFLLLLLFPFLLLILSSLLLLLLLSYIFLNVTEKITLRSILFPHPQSFLPLQRNSNKRNKCLRLCASPCVWAQSSDRITEKYSSSSSPLSTSAVIRCWFFFYARHSLRFSFAVLRSAQQSSTGAN